MGWIYQYALIDRTGGQDVAQLRALQDWFVRFELKTVPDVAEVASVGGMVKQYQIVLDPDKMAAYRVTQAMVAEAVARGNQEAGGSVLELGEAEYAVRASGYLKTLDDFRAIPLITSSAGVSVRLGDVARVQTGPEMRRGIGELNGEGEAVGGVVVMRSGKNALQTIEAVKTRLAELQRSLPAGVEIVPVYDRSGLIERAVKNLGEKLLEEFIVVALVCLAFLFHLRSALVASISLPLGVLMAFIVMQQQGINANVMSLGGIAIAIGAMVDAAIVMIENAHKHLERWAHQHPGETLQGEPRWRVIGDAAAEVGPALFFSLLIITLSFIPVFTLEAQEGRLFAPLAFTKTYAMAASAGLAVTLIPVLMGYLIRGRIPAETANPLNRALIALYRPVLDAVLKAPKLTLVVAALVLVVSIWPLRQLGSEFMPPLDEGDLLYMPTALPGLSAAKAAELLQQTDRLIKTIPEVQSVYGKAGRAETATDPAPLEMFETTIQFKPQRRMARRPHARSADRRARPHRARAGSVQHLGAADPQPHRHAGHRHQEPGGREGGRARSRHHRPPHRRDRTRGEGRARCEQRAGRAPDGWALHRRGHPPRGRRALRPEHRRRAGHRGRRRGRHEHRRDGGGPAAFPDQPALPARAARLTARAARAAHRGAGRPAPGVVRRGRPAHHRRARPCCAAKTRAWPALCTWTFAGATCAARCWTCSAR